MKFIMLAVVAITPLLAKDDESAKRLDEAAAVFSEVMAAQADAPMQADTVSWSRSQGLFAGLALERATLRQDLDDDATLYGKRMDNLHIATRGIHALKQPLN